MQPVTLQFQGDVTLWMVVQRTAAAPFFCVSLIYWKRIDGRRCGPAVQFWFGTTEATPTVALCRDGNNVPNSRSRVLAAGPRVVFRLPSEPRRVDRAAYGGCQHTYAVALLDDTIPTRAVRPL